MHASTFSGNPISMAAGEAAMSQVDPQLIAQMNGLGERLRSGFDDAFRRNGIRGQATGLGSLANIHLTDAKLSNARDVLAGMVRSGRINQLLHLSMLMRGVASASRLMYCTSAPMTVAEVDYAVDALDDALRTLKPGIERERKELLL
jgi:glutamate-1-semialdehyde 2,1-aminomutase